MELRKSFNEASFVYKRCENGTYDSARERATPDTGSLEGRQMFEANKVSSLNFPLLLLQSVCLWFEIPVIWRLMLCLN